MNRKKKEIIKILQNIMKIYFSRGFIVTDVFANGEFNYDAIKQNMLLVTLNISSTDEHVPKVERISRSIKERCRSICHSLPYRKYTLIMIKSLMYRAVHGINSCPNE